MPMVSVLYIFYIIFFCYSLLDSLFYVDQALITYFAKTWPQVVSDFVEWDKIFT